MKITFNPISFIGGLLAWHWYGWHMFVVCMFLTSGLTFVFKETDLYWVGNLWRWSK